MFCYTVFWWVVWWGYQLEEKLFQYAKPMRSSNQIYLVFLVEYGIFVTFALQSNKMAFGSQIYDLILFLGGSSLYRDQKLNLP